MRMMNSNLVIGSVKLYWPRIRISQSERTPITNRMIEKNYVYTIKKAYSIWSSLWINYGNSFQTIGGYK